MVLKELVSYQGDFSLGVPLYWFYELSHQRFSVCLREGSANYGWCRTDVLPACHQSSHHGDDAKVQQRSQCCLQYLPVLPKGEERIQQNKEHSVVGNIPSTSVVFEYQLVLHQCMGIAIQQKTHCCFQYIYQYYPKIRRDFCRTKNTMLSWIHNVLCARVVLNTSFLYLLVLPQGKDLPRNKEHDAVFNTYNIQCQNCLEYQSYG